MPDEEKNRGCPCLYVEPCHPRCTCVTGGSSVGCARCCRYGSLEQRTSMAKYLVERLDSPCYCCRESGCQDGCRCKKVTKDA